MAPLRGQNGGPGIGESAPNDGTDPIEYKSTMLTSARAVAKQTDSASLFWERRDLGAPHYFAKYCLKTMSITD